MFEATTPTYCLSSPLVSNPELHWCLDYAGFANFGDCDAHLDEETMLISSYCTAQIIE